MISGFRRDVDEISPFFLDFLTLEGGTDRLFRNVGTELPFYAA
jgi:hypothetical protein